ncbi:RteC protein [Elizabethkingia anophelis]|nr:RteC protein [Elizabethkingia anophelis]
MVTKTFFRKTKEIHRELEVTLELLAQNEHNIILLSERALMKIDHCIRRIKKMLKEITFESSADEVLFFKHHKPFFISKFIYYSRLLEIESTKPCAGEKNQRKYYEGELLKIKKYQSEEQEFYNYYRRNATYLDYKYFTRNSHDLKTKLSSHLYNFDEDFTTTHDHKIAVFIAHEELENYLMERIKKNHTEHKFPTLQWTSSKVSLLELLYALHLSQCFNAGNLDFIEIVRHTEKVLHINLGNVYKTIGEIKNRKYKRKRFLELLSINLEKIFEEDEYL